MFAESRATRRGAEERESWAGEKITGPFHRFDGCDHDGRPRCWCGSIAERDRSTHAVVCALSQLPLRPEDAATSVQSGRLAEAVDDMALAVESAWRRFVAAAPAAEPGALGLPARSSRGDAIAALHDMTANLHSVFGVDEARRAQLCLWPVASPEDHTDTADAGRLRRRAQHYEHRAVPGEHEGTIACACGGGLSDGGGEGQPITCVRSGVVIWNPTQTTRKREATATDRVQRRRDRSGGGIEL